MKQAQDLGVPRSRLRASDIDSRFHGTRVVCAEFPPPSRRFDEARDHELALIRVLGTRLLENQFFSHRSAALLWEAPLPYAPPELHVSTIKPLPAPRIKGAVGHRMLPSRVRLRDVDGLRVLSPSFTFATLGAMPLVDLVILGDHFARKHRAGIGRKNVGKPPLATREEMDVVLSLGRWSGTSRLREALSLIREDSWSPRESLTRVLLMGGGLPEPELNVDIFGGDGRFLGCVDMAYRQHRVIIEYQGEQHSSSYADDVERIERLRAEGWVVIQVTKALLARPAVLVARVAAELQKRGWQSGHFVADDRCVVAPGLARM